MAFPDDDYAPDAFEVKVSELLVATAESSDSLIDDSVPEVLRLLRQHMHMDVVFVSEFVDGQRVFRRVEAKPDARVIEPGQSSPLEDTFCQRVVDGRLPRLAPNVAALPAALALPRTDFAVGAYMSTPIVLNDGRVYGTLCCFSFAPSDELTQRDLKKLEMSAQLAARKINEQRAREADKAMADWSLEPRKDPRRQR